MFFLKKRIILCFLFLLLLNNCTTILPGINKNPQKQNPNNKLKTNEYSIEDVKVNIIKINNPYLGVNCSKPNPSKLSLPDDSKFLGSRSFCL